MKIRNGFVSNSSSASFIVRWKWKGDYSSEKNMLATTLLKIFSPYHGFGDGKSVTLEELKSDDFNFEKLNGIDEDGKERLEKIREMIKNTEEIDGWYTTMFWTCMYNENNDFGEVAKELMFYLLISGHIEYNYEIIEG